MSLTKKLIGIGVDSVSLNRMARFFHEHPPESLEGLLSSSERKSFRQAADPIGFFARAFAAKEAYFKATHQFWMGGRDGFQAVEVIQQEESRFQVVSEFETEGDFFQTPEGLGARVLVWDRDRQFVQARND